MEFEKLNTMVVSANKANTTQAIKALKSLGFTKISYKDNGIEAIEEIKKGEVEFVLCDMNVQFIPGWLLIKEIKVSEAIRNIPIMLFGSEEPPGSEEEMKQYGVVKYLKMPINVSQVSFTINSTLQLFNTSGTIENKYTKAKTALMNNDVDDAIEMYSELRGQTQNNVRSSLGLAQAHIANKDFEKASDLLEEVAEKDDSTPSTMMIGLRTKLSKKEVEAAGEIAEKLLTAFGDVYYYKEAVGLMLKHKQFDLTETYTDRALQKNFEVPDFLVSKAKCRYYAEDFENTLSFIHQMEEKYPTISEMLNLKGVCYKKVGDYEEAMACYEEALRLSPSDSKVYFNLAMVSINLKKYEDALNFLENCLKLNPDFTKAKEKRDELLQRAN